MKKFLAILFSVFLISALGCTQAEEGVTPPIRDTAEEAGAMMGDALEKAGDAVDDAMEKAGDAADQAGEAIREGLDDLTGDNN